MGSSVTLQFSPALYFGQDIEDMTLLPKALFDGLNQMMKTANSKERITNCSPSNVSYRS
jgi:hypothetical protein